VRDAAQRGHRWRWDRRTVSGGRGGSGGAGALADM
jgi:hypothetical protein